MSKKDDTAARLRLMRKRRDMAITAYAESRTDELDDLKFAAGSPDNQWQWPADVLGTRGSVHGQTINARPCLTINKLPQHIRQVTNDQRQNRPSGKVIPADDGADREVAEIFDGIVRHIEYMSDADVAYDTACESQVTFGEGYFRILTEYCDDTSMDQDIRIGRIRNSFSVHIDPTIQDPCGSDADWCFLSETMLVEDFERMYPDATPVSALRDEGVGDDSMSAWISDKTITIAEYFYVEHESKTLNFYPGGATAMAGSPEAAQAEAMGMTVSGSRKVDIKTVKWCKTNGYEFFDEQIWPGKWIPVIRVIGNEYEVDGKVHVSGIVRNAKDAQRMYNYWTSQEAEMLALAPKAPFIGYGGQFEGYEHQWKTANTTNWPYLEVNPDVTDGQGGALPLPQRAAPPLPQAGLLQAKLGASDDIKSTTGQYDSSLGAESTEKSGRAILARERQTDTGTYHYVDNLARAVRHCTRQIVDLIPKIYDTNRIARIVGIDGEVDTVKLDPYQQQPVREVRDPMTNAVIEKIYNPNVGRYDVCVTTGPSYMTKRQESLESMAQLLQGNPNLWAVAGDLFIKNMDWPGAEEIADRLKKTIDPRLLTTGDDVDPALAAAQQQMQQMQQQMEQMRAMLDNVSKSFEAQQMKNEHFKADIQAYDAETKRLAALSGAAVTPDLMGVVHQYVKDILAQPTLEDEDPQFEAGERNMQAMPMGEQMEQQPMAQTPMDQSMGAQPAQMEGMTNG